MKMGPTSIHENLHITHEHQSLVELNTKKQRECPLWYQLRSCRITSSNFGLIVKRKTKFENLAKQLSCTKQFSNCKVPSRLWGIQNEGIACQLYIENLRKSDPTLVMDYSGLWIDTERSWLVCSPDGLIMYEMNFWELLRL